MLKIEISGCWNDFIPATTMEQFCNHSDSHLIFCTGFNICIFTLLNMYPPFFLLYHVILISYIASENALSITLYTLFDRAICFFNVTGVKHWCMCSQFKVSPKEHQFCSHNADMQCNAIICWNNAFFFLPVTTVVSRLCMKKPGWSNGCRFIQGSGSYVIECLCSDDNCNAGMQVRSSNVAGMLALTLVFIVWRLLWWQLPDHYHCVIIKPIVLCSGM